MKITMPTTFEARFVDTLAALNETYADNNMRVEELYGSFQTSIFGSARPSKYLPDPTEEQLREHIRSIHQAGMTFSFLLNSPCMGNVEHTAEGRKQIVVELERLVDLGVDSVVVTIPLIMEIIRERFPQLHITVSSICYVNTVNQAVHFERMGADRIIPDPDINRNFPLLKKMRRTIKTEMEVIANHSCIIHCPFEYYHYNNTGHGSQRVGDTKEAIYSQYNLLQCNLEKLRDPGQFMKAPWFAPSDVHYLEEVGVEWIKLAGRGSSHEELVSLASVYLARHCEGNLLSVLGWPYWMIHRSDADGKQLEPLTVELSEDSMGGFMEFFASKSSFPCDEGCVNCHFCEDFARKNIHFDGELKEGYISNMEDRLHGIITDDISKDQYEKQVEHWSEMACSCHVPSDGSAP